MNNQMSCQVCEDCGWVCENHPDKSWAGEIGDTPNSCGCGPGMPCESCDTIAERIRTTGVPWVTGTEVTCSVGSFNHWLPLLEKKGGKWPEIVE